MTAKFLSGKYVRRGRGKPTGILTYLSASETASSLETVSFIFLTARTGKVVDSKIVEARVSPATGRSSGGVGVRKATITPATGPKISVHDATEANNVERSKLDRANHRAKVDALLAQLEWVAPPAARDLDLSEPGTVRIKPERKRKLDWR